MLRPRWSPTRELVSLDGLWRFALDDTAVPEPWTDRLATELEAPVPSSYDDLFADQGIRDHVGWVWYQRVVRVPRGWSDARITVRVEAASHRARVYAGDALVGTHEGGFTPFDVDVTAHAAPGEEFRLTIGVDNELSRTTLPPGFVTTTEDGRTQQRYLHDFYNYGGLPRSVWLVADPRERVEDITVVSGIDGRDGILRYEIATTDAAAEVTISVHDQAGRQVADGRGATGEIRVPDAVLWQPGAGYLYDFTVEATGTSGIRDVYTLPVGIRTVEVRGAEFLINGEPFSFRGFGKHEDSPVRGKGHDPAYMVHDFHLMRWAGANSFRTSHYPYAEDVLEYADRHGIVVIDETAAVGLNLAIGAGMGTGATRATFGPEGFGDETRAAHAQAITELIERDRNHPSVVMWCITNEPASFEDGARPYFEPLVALTRELDPHRPVTFANLIQASHETDRIADLFDVICLNRYYGWYADGGDLRSAELHLEAELRGWASAFGKPLVMTEYGADTVAGAHSIYDQPWTEEYQLRLLEMYHRVFDRVPAVVGEQVWNFADFHTPGSAFRVDGNKKGIFTRDRRPKAAAHALRTRWRG
ncbi:Beta-glucuronidase [Microbacterium oxydans]|uniref:beta-glucuronidase n=1 Tax=Microbacterium oxydans TaxID=82380 RepID=UPI001D507003|nr:beta-glucuronidase [Microbacterium oxydans]CAH0192845.1 Beta-glucuronidase [Microbacterium oxydans]